MSELGDLLREARNKKGYSMEYVHEKTGITNSRLSRIERGENKKEPPSNDLNALLVLYDLNENDLPNKNNKCNSKTEATPLKNLHLLSDSELEHIQKEIDFILKLKGTI